MSKPFLTPIDLKQNELQNAVIQNLSTAPTSPAPIEGQEYHNSTSHHPEVYTGSAWKDLVAPADADLPVALAGHTLTGGSVNNTPVGTTTPAAGYFSALREKIGGFFAIFTHANSADRTYTFPDYDGTIATLAGTEALSAKTINSSSIGVTTPNSGYFSALRLKIGGFFAIFTHANSADRTYTFPDKDGTVAMTSDVSGITALTGDVTASGTGSVAATVALVGGASAANVADAVTKRHTQNTDTGTTSTTFLLDSGGTGFKLKDNSGTAEIRNAADNAYADLHVNNLIFTGEAKAISGTIIDIGESVAQFNDQITVHGSNSDAGINVKRLHTDDSTRKDVLLQYSESNSYWQASQPKSDGTTIVTAQITRKVAANVGDGAATSYVITHNLNSRDVQVQVHVATSTYDLVECDVQMTTADTLTLIFAVAPTLNQYRAVIVG